MGSEVELDRFTLTERSYSPDFPTLLIKTPPFCPTLILGLTSDQQGVLKEDNFSLSCKRYCREGKEERSLEEKQGYFEKLTLSEVMLETLNLQLSSDGFADDELAAL